MNFLVMKECEFVAEGFPTVTTLIVFYSRGKFLVLPLFTWVLKVLPILFTYMRCFSSVKFLVINKV